jgi:hypothetical protein
MTVAKGWPVAEIDPDAPVLENARKVIAVRIAEFYSYEPFVTRPEHSIELHDLRIAAKRLRYTLELFEPQLGAEGKRLISRVKDLQEELGNLHDHDVRIEFIGDELSNAMLDVSYETRQAIAGAPLDRISSMATVALRPPPDDPRRGLIALLGREHMARREAYDRFRTLWDTFHADGLRRDLVNLSLTPIVLAFDGTRGDDGEAA